LIARDLPLGLLMAIGFWSWYCVQYLGEEKPIRHSPECMQTKGKQKEKEKDKQREEGGTACIHHKNKSHTIKCIKTYNIAKGRKQKYVSTIWDCKYYIWKRIRHQQNQSQQINHLTSFILFLSFTKTINISKRKQNQSGKQCCLSIPRCFSLPLNLFFKIKIKSNRKFKSNT